MNVNDGSVKRVFYHLFRLIVDIPVVIKISCQKPSLQKASLSLKYFEESSRKINSNLFLQQTNATQPHQSLTYFFSVLMTGGFQ